jgi:hypothetical protein
MSQFRGLIDEREEARRNYEQLIAEIGSIKRAFSEPPNGSSTKADLNKPDEGGGDTIEATSAQPQEDENKNSELKSENSLVHASTSSASEPVKLPQIAAATTTTTTTTTASPSKEGESKNKPTNPEKPTSNHNWSSKGYAALETAGTILLAFSAVICFPCGLTIYSFKRRSRKGRIEALSQADALVLDMFEEPDAPYGPSETPQQYAGTQYAAYPYAPASTAYQQLDTYGPEGVFELPVHSRHELPRPTPL